MALTRKRYSACYELRQELKEFLRIQMKNEWVAMLESSNWLAKLCYLSDIFERINVLNRTLQGRHEPDALP